MLYEDQTKNPKSDDRFHVELHFSPGVVCCLNQKNLPKGPGFRTQTGSRSTQTKVCIHIFFYICLICISVNKNHNHHHHHHHNLLPFEHIHP